MKTAATIITLAILTLLCGCTTQHGIAKNDIKFTHALAESKADIGLICFNVVHDGNYEEFAIQRNNEQIAAQYGGLGVLMVGGIDAIAKWNEPTPEQIKSVRALSGKVRQQLNARLASEVPPLLNYKMVSPAQNLYRKEELKLAVNHNKLTSGLDVQFRLTSKPTGLFSYVSVVRGQWRLLDTEGKEKLVINTRNELPESCHVVDTRDPEHHTYYLNTIDEATTDFAIFFYEALKPSVEDGK